MKFNSKKKPLKHSIKVAISVTLGILLFSFLMAIVYVGLRPHRTHLREGDISPKDVFAPFDFTYMDGIDEKATEKLRNDALGRISPVYEFDSSKLVKAERGITSFFLNVRESKKTGELFGDDEKLKTLRSSISLDLSNSALLSFIRQDNPDEAENTIKSVLYEITDSGILNEGDKEILLEGERAGSITIYDSSSGQEEEIDVETLLSIDSAKVLLEKEMAGIFVRNKKLKNAAVELALQFLKPNLESAPDRAKKKTEEILGKVSPIYREVLVKKNELILAQGQRISKSHLRKLDQLNTLSALRGRMTYLIGLGIILAIFLMLAVIDLRLYEPKIFNSNKNLFLIALNMIFLASVAEAIVLSPWSSYLIPIASISMLLTILINADVALIVAILMSIFCGVIAGNQFGIIIASLAGSCVGIFAVMKVRRRAKLFLAGLLVGITNFTCIVGIGYLNDLMPRTFLLEGGVGFLNGLLSFFIVIGLLPILEYLFKITTDITLLELSDLNHPILKEMVIKAPGTYHHSLLVGNLAEAACDAIGANSLLARVGSYYHDIGKIEKARYFSENETAPNSQHEGLTPSMSALVITGHVRDGTELARRHKMSPIIMDFVEQHHGTSLIYYFYQKALEKGYTEDQLKEQDFRYPGPRPQTKEAAIVLLADSVEASSRTLANPIPSRIRDLVQRIINNKFVDSQLDDCDLTLQDLHRISDSFVRTLSGIFHTRVEYPREKNVRDKDNKLNEKKNSTEGPFKESGKNGS